MPRGAPRRGGAPAPAPAEAAWAAQQVEEEGWATLEDLESGLDLGRGRAAPRAPPAAAPAPAASFHSPTLQLGGGDEPAAGLDDDTGASQPPRGGGGGPGPAGVPGGGHDAAAAAFGTAVMVFAFSQPAAGSTTLPARAAPAAPAPAKAPPAAPAGGVPREAAPEAGGVDALAAMLSTFGAAAAPAPPAAPALPAPAAAAAGAARSGPWRQRAGALGAQGPPPPPPAAPPAWLSAEPGRSGNGAAPLAAPAAAPAPPAAPPGAGAKRKRAAIAPDGSFTREISPTALTSQFGLGVAATRTLFGQQPPVDVALVPTAPCAAAAPLGGAWMLRVGAGGLSARALLAALGARAGDELRLTPLPAGHNGRPAATVALLRGGAPAPPPPRAAAAAAAAASAPAPAAPAPPAAPPAEPARFFLALEAGLPLGGDPPGLLMGRFGELKDALRESGVAAAWDVETAYEALCEADPDEAGRAARSLIGAWRLGMPDAVREMAEDFLEEHADLVRAGARRARAAHGL